MMDALRKKTQNTRTVSGSQEFIDTVCRGELTRSCLHLKATIQGFLFTGLLETCNPKRPPAYGPWNHANTV